MRTLRRAFASQRVVRLREELMKAAKRAMGHSKIQTTMRYIHLVDKDLDSLVDEPADPVRQSAEAQRPA